jgi:hypothetical protein
MNTFVIKLMVEGVTGFELFIKNISFHDDSEVQVCLTDDASKAIRFKDKEGVCSFMEMFGFTLPKAFEAVPLSSHSIPEPDYSRFFRTK